MDREKAHRQSCASKGNRVGCRAPGSWSTRARKEARECVDLAMVWVGGCAVKMLPETGPGGVLGRGWRVSYAAS